MFLAARAIVDRYGVLYNVEPALPALLRRETRNWEGPTLPPRLTAAIGRRDRELRTANVVIYTKLEVRTKIGLVREIQRSL